MNCSRVCSARMFNRRVLSCRLRSRRVHTADAAMFFLWYLECRYKAKVEEGLSRLMAFLREEEERERLEEIERLKPIGTPVGAYLEYR